MKKVLLPSLLAASAAAFLSPFALAQDPAAGSAPGQVTLAPDEYNVYQAAEGQTQPTAKVTALKAYLTKYPNSPVKQAVLTDILGAATQTGDKAQILDASNQLLAVDPQNLRALAFEVYYGRRSDPGPRSQAGGAGQGGRLCANRADGGPEQHTAQRDERRGLPDAEAADAAGILFGHRR